ncbi:MAG: hypothetical protein PHT07_21605 [Paludibacter sp.]|nr:hypothetical protein [Paludibacter sp.]
MEQSEVNFSLIARELTDFADHIRKAIASNTIYNDRSVIFAIGRTEGEEVSFGTAIGNGEDLIKTIAGIFEESKHNELLAIIIASMVRYFYHNNLRCSDVLGPLLGKMNDDNNLFQYLLVTVDKNSEPLRPTMDMCADVGFIEGLLEFPITDWLREEGYKFEFNITKISDS